ncbi:MAG: hypothetical protein ACRDQ2_15855, partial [Gaiellales bacterium]
GLGLCLVAIWLESDEAFDSESYWNLSLSGDHWLGILMLVLVVVGAGLLLAAVRGSVAVGRRTGCSSSPASSSASSERC